LAGLKWQETGMAPATGRSLSKLMFTSRSGLIDRRRDHVLIGKERHDIGRPNDAGYPIRGILKGEMLFIRNYEPDRWPSGNPETGYLNTDGGATKTEILNARRATGTNYHWTLCFGKRPAEELYNLNQDPDCINNLAENPAYSRVRRRLESQMISELKAQRDPRMFGRGEVFDHYPYAAAAQRGFYERYMSGEKPRAGWVNPDDFEKQPLE
jgi:N-sulfoglucosamine sulfohydrolase